MKLNLKGTGVALITPLATDYKIDYLALKKLIYHVEEGVCDYLVVMGTTGEAPVFSLEEHLEVLSFVKRHSKLPLVLGFSGNDTFTLLSQLEALQNHPIDALLSVTPYYNRPSQKGLIRHYSMLSEASSFPIILYNVPSRTGINLEAPTTTELSQLPNIIAIKEASGNIYQCDQIIKTKADNFELISGDDAVTHALLQRGAAGVISVVANLLPMLFSSMVNSTLAGDIEEAVKVDKQLRQAYYLSTIEGNPTSIKAGLYAHGICGLTVKPPLCDVSKKTLENWKQYLSVLMK